MRERARVKEALLARRVPLGHFGAHQEPGRFADFVAEMGEPAPQLTLPPPAPVDQRRLAEVAHKYGIEIVGPPPD